MSTNYYWLKEARLKELLHGDYDDHMHIHIGKRSAAGHYCDDCGTTLNLGGTNEVHSGGRGMFDEWVDRCPSCATPRGEGAVKPCCSFTWSLMRHKRDIYQLYKDNPDEKVIVDEYGEEISAREFVDRHIDTVRIEYQVPREFS